MTVCSDIPDVYGLYGLLIILVVVLIILVVKLIKTISKVDLVVDDVNLKVKKLDGVFNIVDNTADAISNFSDKFANILAGSINAVFNKKRKGDDNDE